MFPAQNLEKPKENRYFRPQAKDLPGLGGFGRFWGQNLPKSITFLLEVVVFAGKNRRRPPASEASYLSAAKTSVVSAAKTSALSAAKTSALSAANTSALKTSASSHISMIKTTTCARLRRAHFVVVEIEM